MASFISPIMRNGKFIGIACMDVSLARLDQAIGQIKIFDTGYAFLVSNTGIFVSFPDKTLIGTKTLADYAKDKNNPTLAEIAANIKNGQAGSVQTVVPTTGKQVFIAYEPVDTGK